ncbi:hypothetical protein B0A55_07125 [Friedmanniomyces simplex]|uniref:Zn(2)-C6 fungal-type domain-containing protein n=1 Tax=Friedmanniomyces simplex TaxID=329884 RepID=A0A4U0XEN0_9PEZI|nr:hypothetical protein B0A55_07125 [Friedmanniomyces simplex]
MNQQQPTNYSAYPPPPPPGVPGVQQQPQYFRSFDHATIPSQQQTPLQHTQTPQQHQPRRQQPAPAAPSGQHAGPAQMPQDINAPAGPGVPPAQDLEDQLRNALQNDNTLTDNEHDDGGDDDHDHANADDDDEGAIFNLPPPPEGNYPSVEELERVVHAWTLEHGYEVVRRASKKNANGVIYKRYYHCSKHGKLANTGKLTQATRVRTNRKTNRQNCPMSMAVVAVDPSNPEGEWQIRHRKTHHNHGPIEGVALAGHRRRARMGGVEKAVDGLFAIGTPTSQVVQFLQRTNPEGLFTRTDVANMKLKYKKFGTCVHLKDQFARDPERALGLPSACLRCRGKKVRCNSARPMCQNCAVANEQCLYDHEPGQAPLFNNAQGGTSQDASPVIGDDGEPTGVQQTSTPGTTTRRRNARTDLGDRRAATEQILQDLQNFRHEHVKPKRLDMNSSSVEILAHSSCGNGDSYKTIPKLTATAEWQSYSDAFLEASLKENTEETLTGAKTEPIRPNSTILGEDVDVEDWNEYVKQSAIFTRRNGILLASLWSTLAPSFRTRIHGFKRAAQAWRALEEMCCPRGPDQAFKLYSELHDITLASCDGKLNEYISRLETAWTGFGRLKQSQQFPQGRLGRSAQHAVAAPTMPGTGMDVVGEEALCFLFLRGLGKGWARWVEVLCRTGNVGGFGTGARVGWREVVRRALEAEGGGTGGGPGGLKISANLHAALKRIQQRLDDGTLFIASRGAKVRPPIWVDAICINQADADERNQQVAQMAQIYASSFAMVIWLGELAPDSVVSAKDSRLWLHALKRLEEYQAAEHSTAIDTPPAWIERQRDDERWERIREAALGTIQRQTTDEERSFVTKLMGLPWFTRRWVVQECIMSTTRYVLYGQHIAGAGAFDGMLRIFEAPADNTLRVALRIKRESCTFLGLLQQFDQQLCADDRDRVYALSSVAQDFRPVVDYRLSVDALYTTVAKAYVQRSQVADLLAVASSRLSRTSARTVPFWVPDWRWPISYTSDRHKNIVEEMIASPKSEKTQDDIALHRPYTGRSSPLFSNLLSAFKVQLSGGYQGYFTRFEHILATGGSPAAATSFFINQTSYGGDNNVPQLTYSLNGQDYFSACVGDSTNGFISLRNNKALGATPDIPVIASLESDCAIDSTLWEPHADSILQVCVQITYLATSLESGCDAVTATLIDGTPQ